MEKIRNQTKSKQINNQALKKYEHNLIRKEKVNLIHLRI